MKEKDFQKLDSQWMKTLEPLREKKVSEKILSGFAASVLRRLEGAGEERQKRPGQAWAFAPVFAVMILASSLVLKSPVLPGVLDSDTMLLEDLELAEVLVSQTQSDEIQDELNVLNELGVLDEYEDLDLLGADAVLLDQDAELSLYKNSSSFA